MMVCEKLPHNRNRIVGWITGRHVNVTFHVVGLAKKNTYKRAPERARIVEDNDAISQGALTD